MTETELDRSLERKTVRATFLTRLFAVLAMLLLVAVLALLVYVTTAIRDDQVTNQERTRQTNAIAKAAKVNTDEIKRVADRIDSCTTPEGDCYKDNARRTQGFLGQISDVDLYVAACALATRDPADAETPELEQRLRQIRACVREARRVDQKP